MKYERMQELFRYVTPGLYMLALVLLVNFEKISGNEALKDTIARFSAIIIMLLPFVGFVLGYFIECLMACLERIFYGIGVPRPSRVVLNGKCNWYVIAGDVRRKLTGGGRVKNQKSNEIQQIAKQAVAKDEVVTRCYYQSIMSRHILGAHLLASIYWLGFAGGWAWSHFAWTIVVLSFLTFFWYHQTCVYMKYLFAEYGKTLK